MVEHTSILELPLLVLEKIISKLPIKTILACRCVCKTLLDLTSNSNPHFAALHSSNATQNLIIQVDWKYSVRLFDSLTDTDRNSSVQELRLGKIFKLPLRYAFVNKYYLVNACNGLIYFATRHKEMGSLVCNPITNEYVGVPELPERYLHGTQTSSSWLGFSPISRVYKVLRFYCSRGVAAHIHDVGIGSSSSTWRDVESKPLHNIGHDDSYAFLNGIGYWIVQYRFVASHIIFFHFETEIFGKIDVPPTFGLSRIGIIGDLLCLIDNHDIWVMDKHGQWFKKVSNFTKPVSGSYLRPLQLLSSGELLLLSDSRNLVCYDMKSDSFREINLHMKISSCSVVTFVPSFVSLKDMLKWVLSW